MAKQYSVAEARRRLPALLRDVEKGEEAEITRRGRAAAVVLSIPAYRRLVAARPAFGKAYASWRNDMSPADSGVPRDFFDSLRDRSTGRGVKL